MRTFYGMLLSAFAISFAGSPAFAAKPPGPLTIPLDFQKVPIVLSADKDEDAKDLRVDIAVNRSLLPIEDKAKNEKTVVQNLKLGEIKYYQIPVYDELNTFDVENEQKRTSATLRFRVVSHRGRAYCEIMPEYRLPIDIRRHPLRVFDGKKRAQEIQKLRVAADNAEVALPGIQSQIFDLKYDLERYLANAATASKEETRKYYQYLANLTRTALVQSKKAEEEARHLRSIRGEIEGVARNFEQFASKIKLIAATAKLTVTFHGNGKELAVLKRSPRTKLPKIPE